ncbi:UNVERIFIED_CONTAM: 26S proteasome regulatory subunitB [Sesamum angustifolium]|uniref:26S proteasome regulatory subunitB n=1 Tax=Sesamum angustifolium TaxID=2727405 RepID=A0AAW2KHA6_9LAMI
MRLLVQNVSRVRKMIHDIFRLAKDNSRAIIFIDEVDSIATARFDTETAADRELQGILMELLNQMAGFEHTFDVKVIVETKRSDSLTLWRLDCKIEYPLSDRRQKRLARLW